MSCCCGRQRAQRQLLGPERVAARVPHAPSSMRKPQGSTPKMIVVRRTAAITCRYTRTGSLVCGERWCRSRRGCRSRPRGNAHPFETGLVRRQTCDMRMVWSLARCHGCARNGDGFSAGGARLQCVRRTAGAASCSAKTVSASREHERRAPQRRAGSSAAILTEPRPPQISPQISYTSSIFRRAAGDHMQVLVKRLPARGIGRNFGPVHVHTTRPQA